LGELNVRSVHETAGRENVRLDAGRNAARWSQSLRLSVGATCSKMEPTGGAAYGSAPSILKCQLLALCFPDPALCISILYATISISISFSNVGTWGGPSISQALQASNGKARAA